jgi:hypothetical protein
MIKWGIDGLLIITTLVEHRTRLFLDINPWSSSVEQKSELTGGLRIDWYVIEISAKNNIFRQLYRTPTRNHVTIHRRHCWPYERAWFVDNRRIFLEDRTNRVSSVASNIIKFKFDTQIRIQYRNGGARWKMCTSDVRYNDNRNMTVRRRRRVEWVDSIEFGFKGIFLIPVKGCIYKCNFLRDIFCGIGLVRSSAMGAYIQGTGAWFSYFIVLFRYFSDLYTWYVLMYDENGRKLYRRSDNGKKSKIAR